MVVLVPRQKHKEKVRFVDLLCQNIFKFIENFSKYLNFI